MAVAAAGPAMASTPTKILEKYIDETTRECVCMYRTLPSDHHSSFLFTNEEERKGGLYGLLFVSMGWWE